jgi:2,3-diaminopropionate biosynthesis protein SbnB
MVYANLYKLKEIKMIEHNFNIIKGKVVEQLIWQQPEIIYEVIKQTYISYHQENNSDTASYFLRFPNNPKARIIALPTYLSLDDKKSIAGLKWIASFPENIKIGLPRASAVIILNNCETGYPYACMEGSVISAARTAGSAVLAAEYINNRQKKAKKIGFVGTGYIAKTIYRFFEALLWEFDESLLFDNKPIYAEKFKREFVNSNITITESLEQLITECDLIVFATTSATPYIHNTAWFRHNPKILHISLRDLAPEILMQANNIVDHVEHVLSANTSPHLTLQQYGNKNFINGTMGNLLAQNITLDTSKPTIFSPMGLGILDLALANYVYQAAYQTDKLISIDDFFPLD